MSLSAPFIRRPVATTLLTVGVALCGGVAFVLLPVAPLPRIDVPAVFVSAQLPGASPEVMAATVATPLERHLGAIADVDDMTSSSSVGSANIQLTFGVDRDIDRATYRRPSSPPMPISPPRSRATPPIASSTAPCSR